MPQITRRLEFDYGHRVWKHEGKCKHLHGHRGVAEVTVAAAKLDSVGRVVDFSVIKLLVGGWIDKHWDHNILLNSQDPLAQLAQEQGGEAKDLDFPRESQVLAYDIFHGKDPYIFYDENPTAEKMAESLFLVSVKLLSNLGLRVVKVRFFETPNSWSDYPEEIGNC